jgi:hypothetical protein
VCWQKEKKRERSRVERRRGERGAKQSGGNEHRVFDRSIVHPQTHTHKHREKKSQKIVAALFLRRRLLLPLLYLFLSSEKTRRRPDQMRKSLVCHCHYRHYQITREK